MKEQLKVLVWIHGRCAEGHLWVLILKTIPEREGFWQPVTGTVELGEALEVAAAREAGEETGWRFTEMPVPLGVEFAFESRWGGRAREHAFRLRAPVVPPSLLGLKLDAREHVEARWVRADRAAPLLRWDSNIATLELTIASLRS